MRGLLRCQYQLQKWDDALDNAKELAEAKGSSADDKALANMAIAKSYEVKRQYDLAIANFKTVVQLNKASPWLQKPVMRLPIAGLLSIN